MAALTYNTYYFTNVDKWQVDSDNEYTYKGVLISSKLNQKNGQDYKLLDAIDIDWNGAWVPSLNSYINTSEDLIKALDLLNQNDTVDDLLKKLQELERILDEVVVSYVSHQELSDILKNYQHALTAGDHITIDNNNVISTYNLVTPEELYELSLSYVTKTELYSDYYNREETEFVAEEAAAYAVAQVVDDADPAFDTLKEIADWILDQDKYTLVTDLEKLEEIKQAAINGEEHEKLYHRNEKGSFIEVEDYTELDTTGETEYYTRKSLLEDFRELEKKYYILQDTVGYQYDNGFGSYTYTGLRWEIDINRQTSEEALNTANIAKDTADIAYEHAEYAINVATEAYETANTALTVSYLALDEADLAYVVAVKASYDVGVPSEEAHFVEANVDYVIQAIENYYTNSYLPDATIYQINENGAYVALNYDDFLMYDTTYNKVVIDQNKLEEVYNSYYYVWQDAVEATGLTKRVEDVEKKIKTIEENVEDNNALLYYLNVDNSYSDYVKLGFKEYEYNGDKHRTLTIQHDTAYIDTYEGIITYNGIPDMHTIADCFTYATSWKILPCLDPDMHILPTLNEKTQSIKDNTLIINYYTPKVKFKQNNIEIVDDIELSCEYDTYETQLTFNIISNINFELSIDVEATTKFVTGIYFVYNDTIYYNNFPIINDEPVTMFIQTAQNDDSFMREEKIIVTAKYDSTKTNSFTILLTQHEK